jgi:hypothetical protein
MYVAWYIITYISEEELPFLGQSVPSRVGQQVSPKHCYLSETYMADTSQKTAIFTASAMPIVDVHVILVLVRDKLI